MFSDSIIFYGDFIFSLMLRYFIYFFLFFRTTNNPTWTSWRPATGVYYVNVCAMCVFKYRTYGVHVILSTSPLFICCYCCCFSDATKTNERTNDRLYGANEINSFGTQFYQLSISVDLKIIPKAINMEYDKSPIKYKTRQITAKVINEKHELQYIKKINHWIRCRFSGTKKKQQHWTFAHIIFINLKYSKVKLFTWINSRP